VSVPLPIRAAPIPAGADVSDVYIQQFQQACKDLRAELVVATPDWAKNELATHNTKNRPLSSTWAKIRGAIQRGGWQVNGEAIVYDRDGRLVNGQHRLTAIAESGISVPLLVVRGVHPDSFATFDQGKRRNASDVLAVEGHDFAVNLAAALGWQQRYESGNIEKANSDAVPNDQILAMAAGHPEMADSVKWAAGHRNRLIPPSMLAFLHYQLSGVSPEDAEAFFKKVCDGVGVEENSHEFNLRRRLDGLPKRDSVTQVQICACVLKAWAKVRLNEPWGSVIVWKENERFPEIV